MLVLASLGGFPDARRDAWGRWGIVGGFAVGSFFYVLALAVQLL